jgi:hypothetical protein
MAFIAAALTSCTAAAATSCTVFNGKSLPAGSDASDAPDASACGCQAVPGAAFCDDFEGMPSPSWSTLGNAPTPDMIHAHCGQWSLHAQSPTLATTDSFLGALVETVTVGNKSLTGGFYLRAWVYLPSSSQFGASNYASIIETRQAADPFLGIGVQLAPGTLELTDWTNNPVADTKNNDPFPLDAWTCVEWQVIPEAATGSTQVWLDGGTSATASLSGVATQASPPYQGILLGLFFAGPSAQPAFDVWIDDVVIDSTRVGCAN